MDDFSQIANPFLDEPYRSAGLREGDVNEKEKEEEKKEDSEIGLTEEEREDLDQFQLGIQLELFRATIDNNFPRQDFANFVDVEDL